MRLRSLVPQVASLFLFVCCALPTLAADTPQSSPACAASAEASALPQPALATAFDEQKVQLAGCTATADCEDGSTVTCSTGTSGATCSGVDNQCDGSSSDPRGYARCGGYYVDCDACDDTVPPPPPPPPSSCSVQGQYCPNDDGYCAGKCMHYCGLPNGTCVNQRCQCYTLLP